MVFCRCELRVRISCVDGRSRYMYAVVSGYLRILDSLSVQFCCTLSISSSNRVFFMADIDIQTCLCVVVELGYVTTSPHLYKE